MIDASQSGRPPQTRSKPRISVNKLGEYLCANAARRRQIIVDQKNPPLVKVVRYGDALRAMVAHLISGREDTSVLSRHLRRLNQWSPGALSSDFEVQKNRDCRDAIQAFQEMAEDLRLDGLAVEAGSRHSSPLDKSGVAISVRPDVIIRDCRADAPLVGAIKLHISKTGPLDDMSAG
jgi:hypothetical protein